MPTATLPDILVLGAGGILGEAWMSGLLAGLEDASGMDLRDVETFVGTSAGSIVAAHLASGGRPRRPRGGEAGGDPGFVEDAPPRTDAAGERLRDLVRLAAMPLAPATLALGAAAGALPRRLALAALPEGTRRLDHLRSEVRRSGVRFDGRLRVCCVDRGSGRRVVFGAPGAPGAEVADAVVASCAIPAVFRPVRIGDRWYVDGGAWSLTNLDAAPAGRGSEILCLHPSARGDAALASPSGALRAAAAAGAELEALALRARGARVRIVGPSREAGAAMGSNFMDSGPAARVHALGYRQGRGLAT